MCKTTIPHRTVNAYRHREFNWQPLFDEIDEGKTQTEVARTHNVPVSTLNQHYQKYLNGVENDDPN